MDIEQSYINNGICTTIRPLTHRRQVASNELCSAGVLLFDNGSHYAEPALSLNFIKVFSFYKYRVEGLLTRGALKPDDRPLWFDVYRAFPPNSEPKFAKPKPEIKPIKPILYKEDAIRAKFHSKGHGLTAVNLLSQTTETQTKRLIQQYKKLQSDGVPENEIIEKSVSLVASERQTEISKTSVKNPDSVTAQVLAEADIKNIFKE